VSWQIVFTKQARKDARRLAAAGLRPKAESLLSLLAENPFRRPPPFERLVGARGKRFCPLRGHAGEPGDDPGMLGRHVLP